LALAQLVAGPDDMAQYYRNEKVIAADDDGSIFGMFVRGGC